MRSARQPLIFLGDSSGDSGRRAKWRPGRSARYFANLSSSEKTADRTGSDRLGSGLMVEVADLELGQAEDLAVGLGGEQFGDA